MKPNVTPATAQAAYDREANLTTALAWLGEVEAQRTKNAGKIIQDEQDLIAMVARLDPDDDEAIDAIVKKRGRLVERRQYHNSANPLRAAVNRVYVALNGVQQIIPLIVQSRSAEEGPLGQCHWHNTLCGLPAQDIFNQVLTVKEAAKNALHDLRVIAEARRPAMLTHEERETGVLRNGAESIRRLTAREMQTGYANA